jgi:uncharacterized protein YbjT (DUF2867 family)
MRVLITGAYGLIGSGCLSRLHRDGHDLVGAGRAVAEASRRFPYARWIEADFLTCVSAERWQPLLHGIDAVVNCVGVLQAGARDDVTRVHVQATNALFDACGLAGIRRVIHLSAIGVASDGPTEFSRTKAEAEAHLSKLDLDWVILRPALVLAPAAYGGSAMLRATSAFPIAIPLVGADAEVQVVSIDDVTGTIAFCLGAGAPAKVIWELAHPQVFSLGQLVEAISRWHGFSSRPIVKLSSHLSVAVAHIGDTLGWLGWRSPARSTAFAQLTAGVVGNPGAWIQATGIKPESLDEILASRPASVQDRWFARLYLLKPLAILTIALFWVATGLIALGPGRQAALVDLAQAGMDGKTAETIVIGGALFDVVLGLLLIVRRLSRGTLLLMLAASPCYLLAGTLLAPALWIDPLGPLTKVLPLLVATAFLLAISDDR